MCLFIGDKRFILMLSIRGEKGYRALWMSSNDRQLAEGRDGTDRYHKDGISESVWQISA